MLDEDGITGLNCLSQGGDSQVRVAVQHLPDCVVDTLGGHAHLLVARESSKGKGADWGAVEIEFLSDEIFVSLKSDLLAEAEDVIGSAVTLSLCYVDN